MSATVSDFLVPRPQEWGMRRTFGHAADGTSRKTP
jgi:hypothetical protein